MSAFEVMRRASLGVFGAIALACASAPGGAFALPRAVGGIHVDGAPLRANAGDPTAAWVARALPGALAQALAEVGRAVAPISVRIDYVILGPSSGGVQAGGAAPDQMIGEVIVGGIAHELRGSTSYYGRPAGLRAIELRSDCPALPGLCILGGARLLTHHWALRTALTRINRPHFSYAPLRRRTVFAGYMSLM